MEIAIIAAALAIVAILVYMNLRNREPDDYYIGPYVKGKNYSQNMPKHPALIEDGFIVDVTQMQEMDYITRKAPDLTRLKYIKVTLDQEGEVFQAEYPGETPTVSLFIQRKGDDWTRSKAHYRWWKGHVFELRPGSQTDLVEVGPNFQSTLPGMTYDKLSAQFHQALQDASRIGVTFGGHKALGHGVRGNPKATIKMTLILLDKDLNRI